MGEFNREAAEVSFTFTPQAVRKIQSLIAARGGQLALRIDIRKKPSGPEWLMSLEPISAKAAESLVVDSIPVHLSAGTLEQLDGLVIDWVMTPEGPGFGVYDRNLSLDNS